MFSTVLNSISGTFSTNLILDNGIEFIVQTIETRIKLAYALASQWFGVYITPEAPNDGMLLNDVSCSVCSLLHSDYFDFYPFQIGCWMVLLGS